MADYGAIAGVGIASGFLQGFADAYARGNERKAIQQAEQARRAAYQQDMMLRSYLETMSKNPGMTTNAGFVNSIQGAGFDPQITQGLTGFAHAIASDPRTQALEDENERQTTLRNHFYADPSPTEIGDHLRSGVNPPRSVMDLAQRPGGADTLRAAADPVATTERRMAENPRTAQLAFEGKVGAPGQSRRPQIVQMAGGTPDNPTSITAEIGTDKNGATVVTPIGEGPAGKGTTVNISKGPTAPSAAEREKITSTEATIGLLDGLTARLPALKKISGPAFGHLARASARFAGGLGLSNDQLEGLQDLAALRNDVYHNLSGAAVFANEERRLKDELPSENMSPRQLAVALKRTRHNYAALQKKRREVLEGSGVQHIPDMPGAADVAEPSPSAPPATAPPAAHAPLYNFGDGMTVELVR